MSKIHGHGVTPPPQEPKKTDFSMDALRVADESSIVSLSATERSMAHAKRYVESQTSVTQRHSVKKTKYPKAEKKSQEIFAQKGYQRILHEVRGPYSSK